MRSLTFVTLLLTAATPVSAQHNHAAHAAMEARGTTAMGFDQARATHHFVLTADGGRIEIAAKDPGDADTATRITKHLEHISERFKDGDFSIPHATHAELPRGADGMIAARLDIDYVFVPGASGGHVRISTRTAAALEAVHTFLRYQIEEHKTGDPLTLRR